MYTDPISDMLTRIRNAIRAGKQDLVVPHSKLKLNLAKLLLEEGYVSDVTEEASKPVSQIQITLKYQGGQSVISDLRRVSKPGQRIYLPVERIPRTNSGFGLTIVSTSKGLLSDKRARKEKVGGEVICQVW